MINKNFVKISIIYFIATISVALIFVLGYFGILQNDVLSSFLIQIVVMFAVPLLLYTLFISKNIKQTFTDVGFKKVSTKIVIISILLGFLMYFLNCFFADLFSTLINLLGYENNYGSTTVTFNNSTILKEMILSAVLPGICEEVLHRGIMLISGKKYTNPRYCLFISSILFGLMHLNINQFFYATIMGALMGYIALISDNIIPSIIIHFMNNFLSNYFIYGYYLNWPFAKVIPNIEAYLSTRFALNIAVVGISIFVLGYAVIELLFALKNEKSYLDAKRVISELNLENKSEEEAEEKIEEINSILEQTQYYPAPKYKRLGFCNNIFVISSMVITGLITISTFLWGVI